MLAGRVFFSLLLVVTAACTAGAPAGVGGTQVESSATDAAIAAPVDDSAAPSFPAGSPPSSATRATCAAHESVLFSCSVAADKRVSICASPDVAMDRGYVYYAYGSVAKPELVFPATKQPPTGFKRTHLTFAGSTGGYAYSFENGGYRYVVYSVSGAGGLEDQGVLVTRGDPRKAISDLSCRAGSVVEDDDAELLDLALAWPADPDLERHGLPHRN